MKNTTKKLLKEIMKLAWNIVLLVGIIIFLFALIKRI